MITSIMFHLTRKRKEIKKKRKEGSSQTPATDVLLTLLIPHDAVFHEQSSWLQRWNSHHLHFHVSSRGLLACSYHRQRRMKGFTCTPGITKKQFFARHASHLWLLHVRCMIASLLMGRSVASNQNFGLTPSFLHLVRLVHQLIIPTQYSIKPRLSSVEQSFRRNVLDEVQNHRLNAKTEGVHGSFRSLFGTCI